MYFDGQVWRAYENPPPVKEAGESEAAHPEWGEYKP